MRLNDVGARFHGVWLRFNGIDASSHVWLFIYPFPLSILFQNPDDSAIP